MCSRRERTSGLVLGAVAGFLSSTLVIVHLEKKRKKILQSEREISASS